MTVGTPVTERTGVTKKRKIRLPADKPKNGFKKRIEILRKILCGEQCPPRKLYHPPFFSDVDNANQEQKTARGGLMQENQTLVRDAGIEPAAFTMSM